LCFCAEIPRLVTRTRVLLFIHRFEDRKSTNTGRLAAHCLANSEVLVRGLESEPSRPFSAPPGSRPLLLYPSEGAIPIFEFAQSEQPNYLIVPDGTWRQASKVRNRIPGLRDIPRVFLPKAEPTEYRLRSEIHDVGLATIEAIARALGVLEGPEIQHKLLLVFRTFVERTLWSRGSIAASEVSGGIPDGAQRHDPQSGLARVPFK